MKTVTILAAMHGIETYGIDLYNEFVKAFPHLSSNVQLIIGNELAYEKQVRFIDVDMNRHYGSNESAHETSEMIRVESLLESFNPDYIIDIHTTKRDSGIFFISDELTAARQTMSAMIPYDVCVMRDTVINKSFIGHHTKGISLEYSLRSISDETTAEFINALALLVEGKKGKNQNKVYNVSNLISKKEWLEYEGLKNYDQTPLGTALMVPADVSEMDAEYYGFWCKLA